MNLSHVVHVMGFIWFISFIYYHLFSNIFYTTQLWFRFMSIIHMWLYFLRDHIIHVVSCVLTWIHGNNMAKWTFIYFSPVITGYFLITSKYMSFFLMGYAALKFWHDVLLAWFPGSSSVSSFRHFRHKITVWKTWTNTKLFQTHRDRAGLKICWVKLIVSEIQ